MKHFTYPLISYALLNSSLTAGEVSPVEVSVAPSPVVIEKSEINKLHILYLLQSQEFNKAVDLYRDYRLQLGRHDFEVLEQMAKIILEQGARSLDPEQQLISLFGSSIAGISASSDILEAAITSTHPQSQLAAIQFLGSLQEDRCEELLTRAMSSDFFYTRMEAAYQLALRKARTAVGQIESLMYRVPAPMRFFFPQFFALIGTTDAIALLKQLMDDPYHTTRIEAILSAARFDRDDLLPHIRTRATHLNVAEQEACAAAMGLLKDSKSIPILQKLATSPTDNVKLAALRSLHILGNENARTEIIHLAKEGNVFAIHLMGEAEGFECRELLPFLLDSNPQMRFNVAFALLKKKNPACLSVLMEFLVRDSKDLGFQPQFSVGNSLMAWKVIPSALQHRDEGSFDIVALSMNVREYILRESLELPQEYFLELAKIIFDARQGELIPLLISLLENLQTPEAVKLLEVKSQSAGAPLIRTYCNLALLRIKRLEKYENAILQWISLKKNTEMIRFRPMLPWNARMTEATAAYELTPEENSRLLIECYQTLVSKHDETSIDILLDGIKTGQSKNRPVLAGLLIQAIQ